MLAAEAGVDGILISNHGGMKSPFNLRVAYSPLPLQDANWNCMPCDSQNGIIEPDDYEVLCPL